MISSTSPLVVGLAAVGALGLAAIPPSRGRAVAVSPMVGTLYSSTTKNPGAAAAASRPAMSIGLDPAARKLLPQDEEILVRFVSVDASSFTLTLEHDWQNTRRLLTSAKATPDKRRRVVLAAPVAPVSVPAPVAVAAAAPAAPVVVAPPAALPTLPTTFTEIDEALRGDSTTQAVNLRLKKVGITFRLTHIGRVRDRYVLRYAIANEEAADFFLSIVNVAAGGKAIHSETAGQFSCPAGQEVFGVVHFTPADAAGKAISVELVQAGGDRRRFTIGVNYTF